MAEYKKYEEFRKVIENAEDISADFSVGLNKEQIESRINAGLTNKTPHRASKTIADIIKDNLLSFFNILLFAIGAIYIYVDVGIAGKNGFNTFRDCLFLGILLTNIIIGFVQDFRARRLCNQLRVVSDPKSRVLRDGEVQEIYNDDIVLSDLLILKLGDQIGADSVLVEGQLDVNESLLTGESHIVIKKPGDMVYSGTYVVGGHAKCKVINIGICNYAETLQDKAKQFKRAKSEIITSIRFLFRFIGSAVVLIGLAMIAKFAISYFKGDFPHTNEAVAKYLQGVLTSLISMIPSGMFLLTSVALTVGVINLSKKRVLVQEMYCIESLARVDTLCLDKTGTITDGTMRVLDTISLENNNDDLKQLLYTLVSATKDENNTAKAIRLAFNDQTVLPFDSSVPFNSAAKCSAVNLSDGRTIVLGAKEFLNLESSSSLDEYTKKYEQKGLRILIIAVTNNKAVAGEKITGLKPIGVVILEDHIREDAAKNIKWFKDNGVTIKVISGDNAQAVSYIAGQVGVEGYENYISLENMSGNEVRIAANKYTVFGRVTPEQKEILISEMKKAGHKVAMTGDGVNDILALKQADCSIAMASGSAAARNASHMVMLDSDFSRLPDVVSEGRRVINNLQRSCSLFLAKTIFAIVMSVFFLPDKNGYPFHIPMMFLWEYLFIGIGAFFLSLQPSSEHIKNGFMDTLIFNSIPAGLISSSMTITYYILDLCNVLPDGAFIIYSVISFTIFAFVFMLKICWRFDLYRLIVCGTLGLTCVVLIILDYNVFINTMDRGMGLFALGPYYELLKKYTWWVMLLVIGLHIPLYVALVTLSHWLKTHHTKKIEERLSRRFAEYENKQRS